MKKITYFLFAILLVSCQNVTTDENPWNGIVTSDDEKISHLILCIISVGMDPDCHLSQRRRQPDPRLLSHAKGQGPCSGYNFDP